MSWPTLKLCVEKNGGSKIVEVSESGSTGYETTMVPIREVQ
jgi:hypothetical protein